MAQIQPIFPPQHHFRRLSVINTSSYTNKHYDIYSSYSNGTNTQIRTTFWDPLWKLYLLEHLSAVWQCKKFKNTAFLFGCLHNFNLGTETKLFHISQKIPEPKLLAYDTILLQFPTSLTHTSWVIPGQFLKRLQIRWCFGGSSSQEWHMFWVIIVLKNKA